MRAVKFGVGQPVKRVEDIRLVSGRGRLRIRLRPRGRAARGFFAQSARSREICRERHRGGAGASRNPGNFRSRRFCRSRRASVSRQDSQLGRVADAAKPYPVMAGDEVHHVGDIVAMVVATPRWQARDARRSCSSIDWEDLPAAVDVEEAHAPGAPLVFAGAPGNIAYDAHIGDKAQDRRGLRTGAAHVASHQDRQSARGRQLHGAARGAVGEYDAERRAALTLTVGSQGVHGHADVIAAAS